MEKYTVFLLHTAWIPFMSLIFKFSCKQFFVPNGTDLRFEYDTSFSIKSVPLLTLLVLLYNGIGIVFESKNPYVHSDTQFRALSVQKPSIYPSISLWENVIWRKKRNQVCNNTRGGPQPVIKEGKVSLLIIESTQSFFCTNWSTVPTLWNDITTSVTWTTIPFIPMT